MEWPNFSNVQFGMAHFLSSLTSHKVSGLVLLSICVNNGKTNDSDDNYEIIE